MADPHKRATGLRRILNAPRCSLEGFAAAARHEDAFRQELMLAAVLVPLGLWLGNDGVERALLAGGVLMVLVVELLNSAVEATVDRVSLEDHQLAKRAKDLGSAAVMMSLVTVGVVWLLVLLPRVSTEAPKKRIEDSCAAGKLRAACTLPWSPRPTRRRSTAWRAPSP